MGKSKLTLEGFITRANNIHNNKFDYSKTEYIGAESYVTITCPIHGDFQQMPCKHLLGRGCRLCGYKTTAESKRYTENEILFEFIRVHGNTYSYRKFEYKSTKHVGTITCVKHGDFKMKPEKHIAGQGCPTCSESKGERAIRNALIERGIQYNTEKSFAGCVSPKNRRLRFDFWLPEHNTCIEYDGLQHFQPVKYWRTNNLEYNQTNDKIKDEYCRNEGIKLIRINYKQDKSITDIISNL